MCPAYTNCVALLFKLTSYYPKNQIHFALRENSKLPRWYVDFWFEIMYNKDSLS